MRLKLVLCALVSSFFASDAFGHEVQPTIGDVSVQSGEISLILRLNLESHLIDIDLDGVTDTDETVASGDYDALRAQNGAALRGATDALIARWNAVPLIESANGPISLDMVEYTVPEIGNIELSRESTLHLRATLSDGAEFIQVNWPKGAGDLVLREQGGDAPYTGYLQGGSSSPQLALEGGTERSGWAVFGEYIPVGFDHILPKGLDHILFVLGLFLFSTAWRPLLMQVTAFTAAHTVTLALGALGWVNLPGSVVEPLIAASIVYVAVENLLKIGSSRLRTGVVFLFGLLHGLGFASVLGEFGLPDAQFIPALLGFNVGVEIGQLTVIALAAGVLLLGTVILRRSYADVFAPASRFGSVLIGLVGVWWVIERTLL